jgi:hypothetical protein
MFFLSGSVRDDLIAVDGQREQRGGERLGAGADLHQGFARKRSALPLAFPYVKK